MPSLFDFCVLGNGPLGAAAAWQLAREGASVCLIGARHDERVSSHNDHSRIYRTRHPDPYWTALAEANLPMMLELEQRTGIRFFRSTPVYYDGIGNVPLSDQPYLTRNGLNHQDPCGGIIDPLAYIRALNKAAREQGAIIRSTVVTSIHTLTCSHQVHTVDGNVARCKAIADFRGLYAKPIGQGTTVARTTLLIRHPPFHEPHCFIRTVLLDPQVGEFFACSHLDEDSSTQTSKFVLADAQPHLLNSSETLQAWFQDGYRHHPKLPWALDEIRRMGFEIQDLRLAPCAFTKTYDGRPKVQVDQSHLRFYGCNGGAVKCAQSLSRQVLTQGLMQAISTS
ncbi:hypothetical protein L861_24070 [Litchfieldella anticariensis FP35 = DSM 16096]|uniref:FAD dependent oxidoreductase domain-containing protein n=1 Tax=Litchfieldella anticariensis (strain DSM 16096 / CECT 5854 / CIP 108499 / LMG 22089 / FP35) TaxID=1121939 RepID=S2L5D3_LITA3|nr:FAD-dependent oxidoreductase [Halomonas anticariensis]EPC02889.1 hypothetical protein L861_24070 [Halomonas anticariensis FP35 = DSM 16096]